jgi:hypothetical protein
VRLWSARTTGLSIGRRYTAVGRKEILHFFYLYAAVQFLALFLDTGIIPTSSPAYMVRCFHSGPLKV